ncbi:MAG: hypothetical protein N3H30_00850 [Candidatus Micrarchaeota archaeon]|nr:hypothetical protein [Candidatus Micrarchaeota archaeon]
MDEKVKSLIIKKLGEWEGESINTQRLGELRELITKKTGKHKFLAYDNLRKWIREVKKEMRATAKAQAKPAKEAEKPAATVRQPEAVPATRPEAVEAQKASVISPFADRVYFQNLTYELGSMRRTLERISKQIDDLEAQLKEFSDRGS